MKSIQKENILKFGLLIGFINIIVVLLIYILDFTLMVTWWVGILILILNFGLVLYAAISYRKNLGGFVPFKDAFVFVFLTLLLSGFLGLIFNMFLYNVLDPELGKNLTDESVKQVVAMMERFGTPEETIDSAIEEARANAANQFSFIGSIKTYLWSFIGYAIGALIIGAIVKKKNPELEY